METQDLAPREPNQDEGGEWITLRKAAELSGLSVPRIYQLANGQDANGRTYDSPFITDVVIVGKIRRELRISRASFNTWMASRKTSDSWGRQPAGAHA